MFVIVVYEMVIFLKVLNHIEAVVADLVEQVEQQANLVQTIVAETIRSLNFCRKKRRRIVHQVYSAIVRLD